MTLTKPNQIILKKKKPVLDVTGVSRFWIFTNVPFFLLFWIAVAWIAVISFFTPSIMTLYDPEFSLESYVRVFTNPLYYGTLWDTLWMATIGSFLSVAFAYPVAYHISRRAGKARSFYTGLVIVVLLVSFLIKMYAWQILLNESSPISQFFAGFGFPDSFLGTQVGVILGLIYASLPYTIMSLTASVDQVPAAAEEAAACFGASPFKVFKDIIFPITMPGVATALIFAIPLNLSAFLAPVLLGRGQVQMTALQIYNASAGGGSIANWPLASALSVTLLVLSIIFTFGILTVVQKSYSKK